MEAKRAACPMIFGWVVNLIRGVLPCVAVRCSALQCVAVNIGCVPYDFWMGRDLIPHCVAVCCSALQCVAVNIGCVP